MATKTAAKPRATTSTRSTSTRSRDTSRRAKPKKRWTSRAVVRGIEAGSSVSCVWCGQQIKFKAKVRLQQVICNVYVKGAWSRVEHFHADCYDEAGNPHGEPEVSSATNPRRAAATPADARPARAPTA